MAFILDERPELTKHRLKILIGSCSIYFLLALPMCFRGGMHLFKVFDSRCSSSLLLLSLIEVRNSIEKKTIQLSICVTTKYKSSSCLDDDDCLGVWLQQVLGQHHRNVQASCRVQDLLAGNVGLCFSSSSCTGHCPQVG